MRTNIAITAFGILALFGPWTLAAKEEGKPTDRSASQREVDRRKTELAEAREDLEAARQGEVSLRLTEDQQKIERLGRPPEYKFRGEDVKAAAVLKREEAVRQAREAYRLALAKLEPAIAADAESASKAFRKGKSFLDQNDFRSAISAFTEAIRLAPQHAEAYELRGLAYAKKGDLDKAIADYTEAIRLDPKRAAAYQRRGTAYERKGDKPHAEKDYARAKKLGQKEP